MTDTALTVSPSEIGLVAVSDPVVVIGSDPATGATVVEIQQVAQVVAQDVIVVEVAQPGAPAGPGAPTTLQLTAAGAVSALRAIVAEGGAGRYPDTGTPADAGSVVGVSKTAAADGDPFDVTTSGEISDSSWSWSPGPVFVGAGGALSQSPGAGWVLEVGRAVGPTRLLVNVKTPILRN